MEIRFEDRKKQLIVAGVVVGIVILISAIWIIFRISSPDFSEVCKLSEIEPIVGNFSQLKNIADKENYESLATFDGYLVYISMNGHKKLYQPLELDSIKFTRYNSDLIAGSLELATNCAKIKLELMNMKVSKIDINLAVPMGNENICVIDNPKIPASWMHYACQTQISYQCITKLGGIIELVVNKIEFQVGGYSYWIKQGKYTNTPEVCKLKTLN